MYKHQTVCTRKLYAKLIAFKFDQVKLVLILLFFLTNQFGAQLVVLLFCLLSVKFLVNNWLLCEEISHTQL